MHQLKVFFTAGIIILAGFGCHPTPPPTPDELYRSAVEDAVFADADEMYDGLTAIVPDNQDLSWSDDRVLVVTFTKYPDSYPEGETVLTWWGTTWVTVVPQLQNFFDDAARATDNTTLRVKQLLGLPRESTMAWFAELWVEPDDLFRPCPDAEIDDTVCDRAFPDNASAAHSQWFNETILSSYFSDQQFPWTRLGYTYDWGDPEHEIGLSEFVIRQDAEVEVAQLFSLDAYIP